MQLETDDAEDELINDEVRWMSVLRSVSALQMYQRAVRGPIDGMEVVRFLMYRSRTSPIGAGMFRRDPSGRQALPRAEVVLAVLDDAEAVLADRNPGRLRGRTTRPLDGAGAVADRSTLAT